jgi:hypothetical protein
LAVKPPPPPSSDDDLQPAILPQKNKKGFLADFNFIGDVLFCF